MILITSAAYVGAEFQAEFGKLPPAFLPVGNKRLFTLQAQSLRKAFPDDHIWVSIPESYNIGRQDLRTLEALNLTALSVPDGLTLADSILYSLNVIDSQDKQVRLLHGDTYLPEVPTGDDLLALSNTEDYYEWEVEKTNTEFEMVWCGFFSFSDKRHLIKQLTVHRGNFVKAIRSYFSVIECEKITLPQWFDLGHINTFYKARAKITTQRSFNELSISDTEVFKTGLPHHKIAAESRWFREIPPSLKSYTPQLLEAGIKKDKPFYILEFLYLAPLNELYVNGNNPNFFWGKIFRHLRRWMTCCTEFDTSESIGLINNSRVSLISDKSRSRIQSYFKSSSLDINQPVFLNGIELPSTYLIIEECIEKALRIPCIPGILHGDLCFSNILYDSRADTLKLIDPRALDADGQFTLYGDIGYDIAKLSHSVIGLYDHLIAGAFTIHEHRSLDFDFEILTDERAISIQQLFLTDFNLGNLTPRDYMPLTTLLFFSMLPLHSDNKLRQSALLANAYRLYNQYIQEV